MSRERDTERCAPPTLRGTAWSWAPSVVARFNAARAERDAESALARIAYNERYDLPQALEELVRG